MLAGKQRRSARQLSPSPLRGSHSRLSTRAAGVHCSGWKRVHKPAGGPRAVAKGARHRAPGPRRHDSDRPAAISEDPQPFLPSQLALPVYLHRAAVKPRCDNAPQSPQHLPREKDESAALLSRLHSPHKSKQSFRTGPLLFAASKQARKRRTGRCSVNFQPAPYHACFGEQPQQRTTSSGPPNTVALPSIGVFRAASAAVHPTLLLSALRPAFAAPAGS